MADRYDEDLLYADHYIGEIIGLFEEFGLKDNTLFALLSDHGEEFMEYGRFEHGPFLYDCLLHVPMIFYYPEKLEAGVLIEDIAETIDFGPTILDILGIDAEIGQGKSLLPLIKAGGRADNESPQVSYALGSFDEDDRDYSSDKSIISIRTPSHRLTVGGLGNIAKTYRIINGNERLSTDITEKDITGIHKGLLQWLQVQRKLSTKLLLRSDRRIILTDEEKKILRNLGYLNP